MKLTDLLPANWRKKMTQSLFEYHIHEGQANLMMDDPDQYVQKGYAGNTTVYSIINRIDNMRKNATLKLYQQDQYGDRKEVTDHELLRFIEKVNAYTYTDDFITEHIVWLLTIGEFFIYRPRITSGINAGKVPEIFAMPSSEVEIIEGTMFDPVKGYRIEGNRNVTFEPIEVYHSKLFNPRAFDEQSLHGQSPLKAASKTVAKLNQIELTQLKQYENQGAPYILFKEVASTGQAFDVAINRMSDPQRADLIREISEASKNSRGLPLVTKDKLGKLDLGQKLADLNIIESSRDAVRQICNIYGFPVDLMNDPAGSTYNNKSTARKSAWTDAIMPVLQRVAQSFNACLIDIVPAYNGLRFDFDYSEVEELQEGIAEKVGWMKQARWTGNEIRQATGKTTVDDPMMDEPIIPAGDGFLADFSGEETMNALPGAGGQPADDTNGGN